MVAVILVWDSHIFTFKCWLTFQKIRTRNQTQNYVKNAGVCFFKYFFYSISINMPVDAFSPSVPFKQKLLQMLDLHRAECSLNSTSPRKSAKVTERTQPFCSHKSCLNTLPAWATLLDLIKQQGKLLLWQRTKSVWMMVRLWKVWAIMTPPPPPPHTHTPFYHHPQAQSSETKMPSLHHRHLLLKRWQWGHRPPCSHWCALCMVQSGLVHSGCGACWLSASVDQRSWGRHHRTLRSAAGGGKKQERTLWTGFLFLLFFDWHLFEISDQKELMAASWHTSFFYPSHYAKMRHTNLMPTKSGINVDYTHPFFALPTTRCTNLMPTKTGINVDYAHPSDLPNLMLFL